MNKRMHLSKNIKILFINLTILFLFIPNVAFSMDTLEEDAMNGVTGQSGIAISVDQQLSLNLATERLGLTDPNSNKVELELKGLYVHGNSGKSSDFTIGPGTVLTVDTEKIRNKNTTTMHFSNWVQSPINMTVDSILAANTNIGSLQIQNLNVNPSHVYMTGNNGRLEFEAALKADITNINYLYNSTQSVSLKGVHASKYASVFPSGSSDGKTNGQPNPNVASWSYTGNLQIGNMTYESGEALSGNNPATYQAKSNGDIVLQLPMAGAIRVEEIKMGDHSFGPMAVDGLKVHSCRITIPGN